MKNRLSLLLAVLGFLLGSVGAVSVIRHMNPIIVNQDDKMNVEKFLDRTRPFSGLTYEEEHQQPTVGNLPCQDGQMFVYTFKTRDLQRREGMFMLASHLMYEEMSGNDLSEKVRIVILTGPTKTLLLTADFVSGVIELREEWNREDKYRMWTWKGNDLTTIARYLTFGIKAGEEAFQRGRRSLETFSTDVNCGRKTDV